MKSQWEHLRNQAENQRRLGRSIKSISSELGIPLSTLSGWLRGIRLTIEQQEVLTDNWRNALIKARAGASEWHRTQKRQRVEIAWLEANVFIDAIDTKDPQYTELALAFLYLGEGVKAENGLRLGNSNPTILKFYLHALEELYKVSRTSLHYALHLRFDQNENSAKEFWAEALAVPIERFQYSIKDARTKGKATRPTYHGVCLISGGSVAIQRRLMYLANTFIERICAISSVG